MLRKLFSKRNKKLDAKSLHSYVFKHMMDDSMGAISIFFVLLVIIISILGSLITPDCTPNANRQILEISLQKPGTKILMLKIPREIKVEKKSFFQKALFGQEDFYNFIPITSYNLTKDGVKVTLFKGDSIYNTAEYPWNIVAPEMKRNNNSKEYESYFKNNCIQEKRFLLGTDRYGRDVLSQLILGSRVSLSVGLISVFIAIVIGVLLGSIAGYYRGWVDELIVWFINVVWSIPSLLLVIAISFALGKGFWQVFIAIGLTMWVDVARVVRGQVMSLREKEFVEAGRALGFSNARIIIKHILPNVTGTVSVIAASNFASAILIESGLSFLGLGVQPPVPSWGTMIKENYGYIILDYAYLAIAPGIAIMLLVLAFMLIGNSLRDALDVKE